LCLAEIQPLSIPNGYSQLPKSYWTQSLSQVYVSAYRGLPRPLEVPMIVMLTPAIRRRIARWRSPHWIRPFLSLFTLLIVCPAFAHALGSSPFDSGLTSMQTLFTGTVAKVASLIAIVVGGYQFAHGEPGAKKVATRTAARSPQRLLSGAVHQRQ
jgi:type IV secretion system protein VirB2